MSRAIHQIPNLGPYMARMLAEIEVVSEGQLRAMGAVEAYARLRFVVGKAVNLNALYGMDAAIEGCHWRDVSLDRKAELRRQLAARIDPTGFADAGEVRALSDPRSDQGFRD